MGQVEIGIAIEIEKTWDWYRAKEDSVPYECSEFDFDADSDFDPDEKKSQQNSPADG